jgi:hypothetical protein
MVKPITKVEITSFSKGFLTEASPLNFPADATRDEENFELNVNGSRDRRLGVDFEDNYQLRSTGYNSTNLKGLATSSFKWFSAGNDANNEFIVVQFGDHIDIYDSSYESISQDGYKGTVTLTGTDPTVKLSYGSVDGILTIAAGTDDIHIVSWDGASFTYTQSRLLVRDLWGLPGSDGNDINLRSATSSDELQYNLRNQGWGVPRKDSSGTLSDPVTIFYNNYSKFPANVETVYAGLQFQPVTSGTPFERIYPALYDDILGLDAPAAKGYFIIDVLRRGASRVTAYGDNRTKFPTLNYALSTLPSDITSGGATIVEDFAGRIFYAGFSGDLTDGSTNSPVLSSYVLFSQVIKSKEDAVKCYQRGDPTSRENSDLVDTDGGFIRISGAKRIYGLVGLSGNLFVLADNGIWKIAGGSDYGFSATNYAVTKISAFGCNNAQSIVVVNDKIFFWGQEGIFAVAKNQFGDWIVESVSATSIQSFYNDLTTLDQESATGFYDQFDKKIRWIYTTDFDRVNFNIVRELVFDVQLGAFSKTRFYNLEANTPEIVGIVASASFVTGSTAEDVVANTVLVVSNGEQVQMTVNTRSSGIQSLKYVTLFSTVTGNVGYTFSQYKDTDFIDWFTADSIGVDATAYMLFGNATASDASVYKQIPYLTMHFLKTESGVVEVNGELIPDRQSSCLVRVQWDFSTSIVSNRWSSLFQAYRYRQPLFITGPADDYDNGLEVITTKNKIRGRGRAFSVYIKTEAAKDCRVLGWDLALTGNNLV